MIYRACKKYLSKLKTLLMRILKKLVWLLWIILCLSPVSLCPVSYTHLDVYKRQAVAGVFTVSGDPLKSYNLPGRPLFVPRLTALFFYAGLALRCV